MSTETSSKKPLTVPLIRDVNNVQLEDIRLMLLDAVPSNYAVVTNDLYFSDSELMDAMRRAVEAFNALPPTTIRCGLCGIPDQYIYKVGTCWQACLTKMLYYQRKVVNYSTGGTQTNMYESQVLALKVMADSFKQEFRELANSLKVQMNARRACGRIG